MIFSRYRAAARFLLLWVALVSVSSVRAQTSAQEVKALQALYRQERDNVVKQGSDKRFLPTLMDRADNLARKSEAALATGRLNQARDGIRQARWQLPYQPTSLPEHVARVIGTFRLRHAREINALAFSPDGSKLATASDEGIVKVWDLGNGHELVAFTGHGDNKVKTLAWTPDGTKIVSAGAEKNVKVWSSGDGKEISHIGVAGDVVTVLALSKDGKHVFTGQSLTPSPGVPTHGLFVYELKSGKLVRDVRDFTNRVTTLALNPEGTLLGAGDENGNVRLFQYPGFVEKVDLPAYWTQQDATGATYHLTFSPDGKTLVRCGPLGVKFYATPVPNTAFQVATPARVISTNGPRCAIFSKDGKTLFTGGIDGNITSRDVESGQIVTIFKNAHSASINGLAFNPAGTQLASCASDYVARLWDIDAATQARDLDGHGGPVWTASFAPDDQRIVSASADKTVKAWDRETGKILLNLTDHLAPVTAALFSPDGNVIASAGGDKTVRIWDAMTGKLLHAAPGHQGTITFLAFSRNSKRIVSGSADRSIKIWDADTGAEVRSINDNPSIVTGVAYSPDGKQIAVANIDQTIRLYDAHTGALQHSWNGHAMAVNGVAYSPNGQYLASCGTDGLVQVWPLATPGLNPIRLTGHLGPVSMVAFRNDNQHLVSCGADMMIKLWKIEGNTGKEMQTFRGHRDWVTSVAFTKDGHHLVSSSVDRKIKLWEITNRDIPFLAEHLSAVETVAVSPDGKIIASGSADRTIKLWVRSTGAEMASLSGHTSAVLCLAFRPDSKGLLSTGGEGEPTIRLWEVAPPRQVERSQPQLSSFNRLRECSPYIAIDPAGKTVFVWLPISENKVNAIIEAFDIDTGAQIFTFTEDSRKINSLAFCANGKLAATGAKDGSVRIWEMKANSANPVPGGDWFLFNKVGVADLALTPDGGTLVATNDLGEVKIATVAGREIRKTFQGHTGKVIACVNSPDGKTFATVGADNIIKLWDIQTGQELRRWPLDKHQGMFVRSIAFTPDSRQLVTGNANTTVYVLDLP